MNSSGGSTGGTFDGIVTLNSAQPFSFTRPPGANYDAVRTTQHEMDEVLGLGSYINSGLSDVEPQDLYSWSSAGTRNTTSSGTRYFSINGGVANIVGFNQNPGGDFGDWLSGNCPQTTPYVQNAFSCQNQVSDITPTSPEGINLDIIGYDPGNASTGQFKFDYDGDNKSDISVFRPSTGSWYLLRSQGGILGVTFGLSTDKIVPADYDGDGKADIAVYRASTGIWLIFNSSDGTVCTACSAWQRICRHRPITTATAEPMSLCSGPRPRPGIVETAATVRSLRSSSGLSERQTDDRRF